MKMIETIIRGLGTLGLICLASLGCSSVTLQGTPPGAVVGRFNVYNYSPSVIQQGSIEQFWWCGGGQNPNKHSQNSDVILYESINSISKETTGPLEVLGETPNSWDSAFTCNPKVVRGNFSNPLGDGKDYTYAMYYVGTSSLAGIDNSIGVAFSTDGIHWIKYPTPVIPSSSTTSYGVGQPAVYNKDGKQNIWLFYEDDVPAVHHTMATSNDGIHFTVAGTLTENGLDPGNPNPSWGDMAYDDQTGYWYAAFNLPTRDPSTTANILERGQMGIQLYRISAASLLNGATPWELLMTVDTNLTGYESNFIPGFLRDQYGNLNTGSYPNIQMYTSMSDPAPGWNMSIAEVAQSASPSFWNIGSVTWSPNTSMLSLNQYFNGQIHIVTTGWIDPHGGFIRQSTLGHLLQSPQQGSDIAFYSCKRGATGYFVTLDSGCSGEHIQGIVGYGYSHPIQGKKLVPIYTCTTNGDQVLSQQADCDGTSTAQLIGYALP